MVSLHGRLGVWNVLLDADFGFGDNHEDGDIRI